MRFFGNSVFSAVSTWRVCVLVGSTVASTVVNLMPRNGSPSTIRKVALSTAIGAGRRITKRDRRYQKPRSAGRASASAARRSHLGDSAFTRGPRTASAAVSTTSATLADRSATSTPPTPIE